MRRRMNNRRMWRRRGEGEEDTVSGGCAGRKKGIHDKEKVERRK